tara:strand:- start:362 stop:535 length:174 start_codon:yes stop_codon:yes gene_type:complete
MATAKRATKIPIEAVTLMPVTAFAVKPATATVALPVYETHLRHSSLPDSLKIYLRLS